MQTFLSLRTEFETKENYEIMYAIVDIAGQQFKVEKQQKMRMRRKIRDEIFLLLTWEKPSPSAIIKRWEDRLFDVFQIMPFGFKDDLLKILIDQMVKT